jgi:hypothetical protein
MYFTCLLSSWYLIFYAPVDKYNDSGIYQMKCLDCPLKYIGQTGKTFHTRYKEHIRTIKNNNSNSQYSNHILNTGHKYGTITDTMETRRTNRKHLNTLEKYKVRQFNAQNGRSVLLGYWVMETHVPKHVWTCSNMRLDEPQTKWVIHSQAAEEVVCVRGILLGEKWVTRIWSSE